MPLNAKGRKILRQMKETYPDDKAKEVFYASINKGKIRNVEKSSLAKQRRD